ncbi:MAG: PsbP-related protein [bacterium]
MQFSLFSRDGVKSTIGLVCAMALANFVLGGCQQKPKVAAITGWQKYQDPYFKLQFSYPQGWYASPEGGKVSLYPSQDGVQKFFENVEGVEVVVSYAKLDSTQPQTLAAYKDSLTNDLSNSGYEVNPAESRTIDDSPASIMNYRGRLTEQTYVSVLQAVTIKDSVQYSIKYSALNELFTPYRSVFDSVVASARLPKAMAAVSQADPSLPSPDFVEFDNKFLRITHPGNFEPSTPAPKGEALFTLDLKGYRQDCTIRVDVLPAKGLTVEKVAEQNAKFYKGGTARETKISGERALYFNYTPIKGVESRAHFYVKNDKIYRIIANYYQPMRSDFLPAFEKTVASLQVK